VEPAPLGLIFGQLKFVAGEHDCFGWSQAGMVEAAEERFQVLAHRTLGSYGF
jgi:hypothetical protein